MGWVSQTLVASGPRPSSGSFTASFAATANPIDPTTWDNGAAVGLDWNDIQSSGGRAYAAVVETDGISDDICVLRTSVLACTANQFAQATVFRNGGYSPSGTHELSLLVRFIITAHSARGIEWYINTVGGSSIVRWNGAHNDYAIIASPTCNAPADGDVFRMEISGSTISVYQNGVLKGTATDSTYSDGNPGFGNNPVIGGSATTNDMGYSAFTAGNL